MNRRDLLGGAAGSLATAAIARYSLPHSWRLGDRRPPRSRVAILWAPAYREALCGPLHDGLVQFHLPVRGQTVLLKPNLVEVLPGAPVNTHPLLVSAAIDVFLRLGAQKVIVAEGPGHQRDTELVLIESGYTEQLRRHGPRVHFVDLNRDEVVRVPNRARFTGLSEFWLPKTLLAADFVVSMPKVKTHHWAGVTLAMKNLFGVVPGSVYGWPKNLLHWHGIQESILDLVATVPVQFVIADGITAMEGNGPLHGPARDLGCVVLADNPVAADATCCRLMGLVSTLR